MRASTWEKFGIGEAPRRQMKIHDAAGCTRCFGTGYLGRVGIYEVLAMDEQMGDMIERGVPVRELREAARARASSPCVKMACARSSTVRPASPSWCGWSRRRVVRAGSAQVLRQPPAAGVLQPKCLRPYGMPHASLALAGTNALLPPSPPTGEDSPDSGEDSAEQRLHNAV